jgi:hypothetical protein
MTDRPRGRASGLQDDPNRLPGAPRVGDRPAESLVFRRCVGDQSARDELIEELSQGHSEALRGVRTAFACSIVAIVLA